MSLKVIAVKENDTDLINVIVEELVLPTEGKPSSDHLKQMLTDNRTFLFAALFDNRAIGYALAYRFPSLYDNGYLAYLYDIEVLPTYRRKGAGRLLMETLLQHLKTVGVTELWLGTATNNTEAQALFASTGGIKSGETFNDFTYEL